MLERKIDRRGKELRWGAGGERCPSLVEIKNVFRVSVIRDKEIEKSRGAELTDG